MASIEKKREWLLDSIRKECVLYDGYLFDLSSFISFINMSDLMSNVSDYYDSIEEVMFNHYDNYKEFALPVDILEHIDFRDINFDNFNASSYDFSKLHNVKLDVSKVYNKDLSNSNLSGVELVGNFKDVDLANAKITDAIIGKEIYKQILLRQRIMSELSKIEEGMHITLDFDEKIIDYILFDYSHNFKSFALPRKYLEKIDFSNVNFKDFKAHDFDFSNLYGVKLNPQILFDKNLMDATLKGVEFIGPFDEVKICRTDFSGSKGAFINPNTLGSSSINTYDIDRYIDERPVFIELCNFKDVTFTEEFLPKRITSLKNTWFSSASIIYKTFNINGCNFKGSTNAKINLGAISTRFGLIGCTLTDATLNGDFYKLEYAIPIHGCNFRGAKRAKKFFEQSEAIQLDPKQVKGLDLSNCIFDGVCFTDKIKLCDIHGSDFTGSINALIDLRKNVYSDDTNFTDAKVIGENGEYMNISEDGKPTNSIDVIVDKILGLETQNIVVSKEKLEEAKDELLKENRKKLQEKINELLKLVDASIKLGVDPKHLYCSIPIEEDELLVRIDDHFEINRNFIGSLRFLNLSMIDFTNVKVSGIDFRKSAARINPQTVYNKDLSNGVFDASNIKFFDDLTGVNIEGADFSECEITKTK